MNMIQDMWEMFSSQHLTNASEIQKREMEKAFYSGALCVISILIVISNKDVSEEVCAAVFEGLRQECAIFCKGLVK